MKILIFVISIFFYLNSIAQNPAFAPKHDNIWLTGFGSFGSSLDVGGARIDFKYNQPLIIREDRRMNFEATTASMSDLDGNLLFYTNAYYIANALNDTMQGGEKINPDSTIFQDKITQGVVVLPCPGYIDKFVLLHEMSTFEITPYSFGQVYKCLYSMVDMKGNNGLGVVSQVNNILIEDTLCYGKLTACKHANGRDWWILIPKWNSDVFFTYLLTPNGFEYYGIQKIGPIQISGLGQSVFSPDGSKYVKYNAVGGSIGAWLDIYDFDRCTGMLSNCQTKYFDPSGAPGVGISPSSQYLYVSNGLWLYQYNLKADSIFGSEVLLGTYDGHMSPGPTYFFMLQLAPNGKLYMNSAAVVNTLHIIHSPDLPGQECRFEQHGVQLPTLNDSSIPTFPNYRLGPLDGSPCDTLGLNNLPAAHFRWEFWDTLSPLHVYFTDLSVYEPAEWYWDFGDGATSTEISPEHTYAAPGVYPVCLSVRNQYGADTACYDVTVGVASESAPWSPLEVSVAPNPFRSVLAFAVPSVAPWQRIDASLRDLTGRELARTAWRGAHSDWHLAGLPPGVYVYEIITEDGRRQVGKVQKW